MLRSVLATDDGRQNTVSACQVTVYDEEEDPSPRLSHFTLTKPKTKVVTFGSKAACQAFVFNSNEVERVESYKYLGFEFHATKNLAHGVSQLVSAAKKAMHSMNRRCALLPISDPELRCKLFDSLVLPILSYASEVWGVDEKIGDAAELLHRQFLKHILGARDSTANHCTC